MVTLYEDNAGGLHMTDGKIVVSGLEHQKPGSLLADIATFSDWAEDATRLRAYSRRDTANMRDIARYENDEATVFFEYMGNAGKRYAGII